MEANAQGAELVPEVEVRNTYSKRERELWRKQAVGEGWLQ